MFLFLRTQQRAGGSEPADQVAQGRKNSRPGGKSCGQPAIVIWKETRKLAEELACDGVQLSGGCTVVVRGGRSGASGEGRAVPCALRAARI